MKEEFEKLGILSIMDYFRFAQQNFKYGWIDKYGNKHLGVNDAATYSLQSPLELLKSRVGICWDLTELSRSFFEEMTDLKIETYYLFYDDNAGCPCHTFLVFYKNGKVYWFEPMCNVSSFCYSGIYQFENISVLLNQVCEVFLKINSKYYSLLPNNYNPDKIFLYKYEKFPYHINGHEVRNHIDNSEKIRFIFNNI